MSIFYLLCTVAYLLMGISYWRYMRAEKEIALYFVSPFAYIAYILWCIFLWPIGICIEMCRLL